MTSLFSGEICHGHLAWSHQALQWSQSLQLLSRALQTSLQRLEVAWAACAKACGTWWQAGQRKRGKRGENAEEMALFMGVDP
jgi:hypothetical protein